VYADPDGNPGLAGSVACLGEEILRRVHGARGVIRSGEARDEERDRLVADELVDDSVPAVDHARGRPPVPRQELAELSGG